MLYGVHRYYNNRGNANTLGFTLQEKMPKSTNVSEVPSASPWSDTNPASPMGTTSLLFWGLGTGHMQPRL